jgi:hypothetical protein
MKIVKEVISTFDFDKVHKVMTFLNWTWYYDTVPDLLELKSKAQQLLVDACERCLKHKKTSRDIPYIIMTGGFRIEAYPNKKKTKIKELRLEFVLATSFDYR